MKYGTNDRQSIRLAGYDYQSSGAYFVTMCTHRRECFLDDAATRKAIELSWRSANGGWEPEVGEFVVMPNHVHGVAWIKPKVVAPRNVGAQRLRMKLPLLDQTVGDCRRSVEIEGAAPLRHPGFARNVLPGSIGAFVRTFKSLSTKRINALRGKPDRPIWQRDYYEHIIRDEADLQRVRQYIVDNPAKWEDDPNHPSKIPTIRVPQ